MDNGWENIIGQATAKFVIRTALSNNRMPHAWLFSGPEGVGKDAAAIEVAKYLLCENKLDKATACQACRNCRAVGNLQHPNLKFIFALPTGKNEDGRNDAPMLKLSDGEIALIQEQLVLKANDPYHNISISKANQIKISSIREVKKDISFSSMEPGMRIVIVSEADKMGDEAANAFLKTLEEPAKNTLIILTSSNREKLLTTIISRCQEIRFQYLLENEIQEILQNKYGTLLHEAQLFSKLAEGSLSKALEIKNGSDISKFRDDVVAYMRACLKRSPVTLFSEVDRISNGIDKSKLEKILSLLLLWIRDAYYLRYSKNEFMLVNQDQITDITSFNNKFPKADLKSIIEDIDAAINAVKYNAQAALVLINLGVRIEMSCYNN